MNDKKNKEFVGQIRYQHGKEKLYIDGEEVTVDAVVGSERVYFAIDAYAADLEERWYSHQSGSNDDSSETEEPLERTPLTCCDEYIFTRGQIDLSSEDSVKIQEGYKVQGADMNEGTLEVSLRKVTDGFSGIAEMIQYRREKGFTDLLTE